MVAAPASLDTLCINSIRMLAVDAINKSNSGHPGLPMGCAPMGYALWDKFLNHNPKNPKWFNRDRFVLSAGHGCMLLYALLHLTCFTRYGRTSIFPRTGNLHTHKREEKLERIPLLGNHARITACRRNLLSR